MYKGFSEQMMPQNTPKNSKNMGQLRLSTSSGFVAKEINFPRVSIVFPKKTTEQCNPFDLNEVKRFQFRRCRSKNIYTI
jgi:hypothetical protein